MNHKGKILVVDDELHQRLLLNKELSRVGYSVDIACDGEEALKILMGEQSYNVVLLDIIMPKKDGITVLKTMRKEKIFSEIIILTANATIESAIECIKLGAYEYVKKPYILSELLLKIDSAISHQNIQSYNQILKQDLKNKFGDTIIGNSQSIKELRKIISRIAPTQSTVLILGESGSGKELVARAIHEQSANKDRPFVAINCASLSETLLESELFGYEKGAFTDAKNQKRGLAEIADGGTLFLDEIGEIPIHFQAKLLRFLETGEIRRVGGTKDIKLNVRILCATNKPLEKLVMDGEFRADLYYRLNVLSVTVPPLKNHREDIPLLIKHIIKMQGFNKEFDSKAIDILKRYDWPGNVRELKNVIERSCVLCSEHAVSDSDLSFLNITPNQKQNQSQLLIEPEFFQDSLEQPNPNSLSLEDMERNHIIRILKLAKGHKGKAAELLNINPKTLYYKMKNFNIMTDFH